jgi:hypothetical protein
MKSSKWLTPPYVPLVHGMPLEKFVKQTPAVQQDLNDKAKERRAARERAARQGTAGGLLFWAIVMACIAGGIGAGVGAGLFGFFACVFVGLAIWQIYR